jgi:hypothetical protein
VVTLGIGAAALVHLVGQVEAISHLLDERHGEGRVLLVPIEGLDPLLVFLVGLVCLRLVEVLPGIVHLGGYLDVEGERHLVEAVEAVGAQLTIVVVVLEQQAVVGDRDVAGAAVAAIRAAHLEGWHGHGWQVLVLADELMGGAVSVEAYDHLFALGIPVDQVGVDGYHERVSGLLEGIEAPFVEVPQQSHEGTDGRALGQDHVAEEGQAEVLVQAALLDGGQHGGVAQQFPGEQLGGLAGVEEGLQHALVLEVHGRAPIDQG